MKEDRFLIGILVGIGVLITAALVVFFMRQGDRQTYTQENTPDGVVHNYVLALQQGDFQKAYGYLADEEGKPGFGSFRSYFTAEYNSPENSGIQITGWDEDMDLTAWVDLTTVQISPGPFSGVSRNNSVAHLIKNEKGDWKIKSMPYPFWGWDWYNDPYRP
jgi:hypothetical protein